MKDYLEQLSKNFELISEKYLIAIHYKDGDVARHESDQIIKGVKHVTTLAEKLYNEINSLYVKAQEAYYARSMNVTYSYDQMKELRKDKETYEALIKQTCESVLEEYDKYVNEIIRCLALCEAKLKELELNDETPEITQVEEYKTVLKAFSNLRNYFYHHMQNSQYWCFLDFEHEPSLKGYVLRNKIIDTCNSAISELTDTNETK